MPFFLRPQVHQPFHGQDDLFNILAALDPSTNLCPGKQRQACKKAASEPTFTPRFDVLETPTTYELYGELAGLKQEDLNIEFEDVQTLVIKGKTSRQEPTVAQPKGKEVETVPETISEKEHQATVEDDYDVADTPLSTSSSRTSTPVNEKAEPEKKEEEHVVKPKYWVSERRVGSFERKFSFSQRLDIDEVKAELRDGVLRVVVPKNTKGRKVAVSLQ